MGAEKMSSIGQPVPEAKKSMWVAQVPLLRPGFLSLIYSFSHVTCVFQSTNAPLGLSRHAQTCRASLRKPLATTGLGVLFSLGKIVRGKRGMRGKSVLWRTGWGCSQQQTV